MASTITGVGHLNQRGQVGGGSIARRCKTLIGSAVLTRFEGTGIHIGGHATRCWAGGLGSELLYLSRSITRQQVPGDRYSPYVSALNWPPPNTASTAVGETVSVGISAIAVRSIS